MKKHLLALFCLCALTNNNTFAYDTYNFDGTTYSYTMNVYDKGESLGIDDKDEDGTSVFKVNNSDLTPLFESAKNWTNVVNGSAATSPVSYMVYGIKEYNAMAGSFHTNIAESEYKVTNVNARINNRTPIETELADTIPTDGLIGVGLGIDEEHPGWANFSGFHSLYHGEIPDFNAVITHEIMHSLGVTTYAMQFYEEKGDEKTYFSRGPEDSLSVFDKDLRIYTGDTTQPFDQTKEVVPRRGMAIGENEAFDVINNAPYYVGRETLKVIAGKDDYDEARQAIIDNGGMVNYSSSYKEKDRPVVYGMPIHNAEEGEDGVEIDLAHLELRNSYMSHQEYRNWLVPMEAELAVLKDIGYRVDLRKHFGKSYYLNNIVDTFDTGYSEWDGEAYTANPSQVVQGVGLHIYGDNNNITQASDILTIGEGAFGARIDGEGNTYTLASGSVINADGKENIALGVTWGRGHTINVESGSEVTAIGEDGIAASFDFGGNLFGTLSDVRGSYINYDDELEINSAPEKSTQGALVENFNVAGNLEGKKAAIYIADNAHVKNINLQDGATINGDIISEWNSVSSGNNRAVQKERESYGLKYWTPIKPEEDELYYTNLNIVGDAEVNGNITGENETANTLKLNNTANLDFNGTEINVNTISNSGVINISKPTDVSVENGYVTGAGNINVLSNGGIDLNSNVKEIENTVELNDNSFLSTMNDEQTTIKIEKLNSNNAKLSFDLGDKLQLTSASDVGKTTAQISQIKADEQTAQNLNADSSFELFEDNTLSLGETSANVYYGGNKYTLKQSGENENNIIVSNVDEGYELSDAVEDVTTANYIVSEDSLTKDAGSVAGSEFEISGKDINVNGHNGLVVDGAQNANGTVLKTGISRASNSNITVQNNGKLGVLASDGNVKIGNDGETAITVDDSTVVINSFDNSVNIAGALKGANADTQKNIVSSEGKAVTFSSTDNVTIAASSEETFLNGVSKDTAWQVNSGTLNLVSDNYLASDGSNKLIANGGIVNTANNQITNITLDKMTLNNDMVAVIDLDLKDFSADRFVFEDSADLETNGNLINIAAVNLLNANSPNKTALTNAKYSIPLVDRSYHNEKLLGGLISSVPDQKYMSPIFKYTFGYEENGEMAGFALSRGSASNYNSYNPSVYLAPVAAQLGGYLAQLNSYDEAFYNMDMYMLMTASQRQALKNKNKIASLQGGVLYDSSLMRQERAEGWLRPYVTFEKVPLKNGPKVSNMLYGSFMGSESKMYDLGHGWDGMWGAYVGYNGSHQSYNGVSMYQNGGTLGLSGMLYKGNFFNGLTVNTGANSVSASTMYGSENFPMLMAGVADKLGYNWELFKGKFIIQPNMMFSYTFVNAFDYHNGAGVKISSDPLNAIQIQPEIKFIGNLKNGWQPYASVAMIWNIMDDTKFKANNVSLPDFSIKPFVKYGAGIRKAWGERFTGFFQTYVTNGGRNGVGLQSGFTWAFGK